MNFDKFDVVEAANERKKGGKTTKEQNYTDLRYRRVEKKNEAGESLGIEGRFYVANAKWAELGLDSYGMKQFVAPDGEVLLALVANENASFLKATAKGKGAKIRNFKSTKVEAALTANGTITNEVGPNQFITLEKVADTVVIKGITCFGVYKPVKGAAKPKATPVEKAIDTAKAENTVAATPVATPTAEPVKSTEAQAASPAASAEAAW